ADEPDPPCLVCGGILKSDTISFGQALDQTTLRRAFSSVLESDMLIAIGTSLQVHPVASLVDLAVGARARAGIVNAEPTPYHADPPRSGGDVHAVLRDPIGTVLPALVAAVLTLT